jgi:hypothetical protein
MDGTTAVRHLEMAILRLQGAIELLTLLDGMEQEITALEATEADLLAQLMELNSLEAE